MKISTTHEIVVSKVDPTRGRLVVHVLINDDPEMSYKHDVMAGPLDDVRAFALDEIGRAEVFMRWTKRGT